MPEVIRETTKPRRPRSSKSKGKEAKIIEEKAEIENLERNEVNTEDDVDDFDLPQAETSSSFNASAEAEAAASSVSASSTSSTPKNFRHHPDMENFYRFIFENDLRFEALDIIDKILVEKQVAKAAKIARTRAN